MNMKTSWNQAQQQKSHLRDKHLGSSPPKVFSPILKVDKRGIQANEPEDKKIDDYAQGLTSERWEREGDSPALKTALMHQ